VVELYPGASWAPPLGEHDLNDTCRVTRALTTAPPRGRDEHAVHTENHQLSACSTWSRVLLCRCLIQLAMSSGLYGLMKNASNARSLLIGGAYAEAPTNDTPGQCARTYAASSSPSATAL
jgi:hypothetical protein